MRSHKRIFGVKHIFYALMIDNSFCVVSSTFMKKKWKKIHFLSIVWNCLSVTWFSYKYCSDLNERHHSHSQLKIKISLKVLKILVSKMNLGKLIGFLYVLVILALVCHFASASPKQYDGGNNNNNNNADR